MQVPAITSKCTMKLLERATLIGLAQEKIDGCASKWGPYQYQNLGVQWGFPCFSDNPLLHSKCPGQWPYRGPVCCGLQRCANTVPRDDPGIGEAQGRAWGGLCQGLDDKCQKIESKKLAWKVHRSFMQFQHVFPSPESPGLSRPKCAMESPHCLRTSQNASDLPGSRA